MNLIWRREVTVGFNDLRDFLDGDITDYESTVDIESLGVEFVANEAGQVCPYGGIRSVAGIFNGLTNFRERNDIGIGTDSGW